MFRTSDSGPASEPRKTDSTAWISDDSTVARMCGDVSGPPCSEVQIFHQRDLGVADRHLEKRTGQRVGIDHDGAVALEEEADLMLGGDGEVGHRRVRDVRE